MKFTSMTEEQIAASGLLPEGVYDFTIVEAIEKTSNSGNDMFQLKLNVFDPNNGNPIVVMDWILPSFPKKFKHIHDACGLLKQYQDGNVTTFDLEGKSGKLLLGIGKPYTDKNGLERVNNSVVDYVKRDNMIQQPLDKTLDNDEIPFG